MLAGAAWLLTVAVATAVATWAVGSMRQGIFGTSDAPYSEADVEARLAASSSGPTVAPPTPAPSSAPASSPAGVVRALTTSGGTIVAVCEAGLVTLRSWTPNAGFEAERVQRGPAAVASLRFKARSGGGDVRAQVVCSGTEPRIVLEDD
ncbi:hypothetical protein GCM10027610_001220 [Dactylosporangium cerinum]